jgi:hypothetical protein
MRRLAMGFLTAKLMRISDAWLFGLRLYDNA